MSFLAFLINWPYRRSYKYFTAFPLAQIGDSHNEKELRVAIDAFRVGKVEEINFVRTTVSFNSIEA